MRQGLNIGFDAKRAFVNTAGLGNYSRNTILSLSRFYPENAYFLFTPQRNPALFDPPRHTAVIAPESIWWNTVKPLWRTYKVTELAQKSGLDIFHGLSHELPVGIEKTGIKSLVTIHDLIFVRYPKFYKAADRRIYFRKYKHACAVADKIIAISKQTKHDLVNYFQVDEQKIEVIYQGINPIFFNKVPAEELEYTRKLFHLPSEFILAPGTIEARKNLGGTLQALLDGNIKIPLVIVGRSTKYMNVIKPQIQKLRGQLIFLHKVSDRELNYLYRLASLTVFPSFFEGFGLPVAEAQASGCPVVTSNLSSLLEAGGDGAFYVSPDGPDEIAAGIQKILEDSRYRKQLIKKGKENAERFMPENYARSLMNIYQKL